VWGYQVRAFTGAAQLLDALSGCDVVVIPAGVPRKPGMTVRAPACRERKRALQRARSADWCVRDVVRSATTCSTSTLES
jgi:hypothetical protein